MTLPPPLRRESRTAGARPSGDEHFLLKDIRMAQCPQFSAPDRLVGDREVIPAYGPENQALPAQAAAR
jgi:hypothetical protein